MIKQEEIREGINEILTRVACEPLHTKPTGVDDDVEELLQYLHSQGVVIKVERELPRDFPTDAGHAFEEVVQSKMLKAGYEAVEPLI